MRIIKSKSVRIRQVTPIALSIAVLLLASCLLPGKPSAQTGAGNQTSVAGPGRESNGTSAGSDPTAARRTAIVVATEKAAPAVVSITVRRTEVVAYGNSFFQDPFFDLFGPQYRRKEMSSLGSGVIVSKEGFILTNSHVVGGGEEGGQLDGITVTLPDGRQLPAKLVGADGANDLAVVKIKAPDLPVASLQEKPDNLIGEWVVAIGNPYGYLIGDTKPTVTVGVISAVNRSFSSNSD